MPRPGSGNGEREGVGGAGYSGCLHAHLRGGEAGVSPFSPAVRRSDLKCVEGESPFSRGTGFLRVRLACGDRTPPFVQQQRGGYSTFRRQGCYIQVQCMYVVYVVYVCGRQPCMSCIYTSVIGVTTRPPYPKCRMCLSTDKLFFFSHKQCLERAPRPPAVRTPGG